MLIDGKTEIFNKPQQFKNMKPKHKTTQTEKTSGVNRRTISRVRLAQAKDAGQYPKAKAEYESEKKRYLMQIGDELDTQQALVPAVTQRLEGLGFTEVNVTCKLNGWEVTAARGTNQSCRTSRQFKALIEKLISDLNRTIDDDFLLTVVQGDHLSAAFRLQRTV